MLDYQAILALLKIPMVRYIVILKLVVGIPVGVFHSMFTMVNIEKFGLTAETNGHLLSYVGIITMVSSSLVNQTVIPQGGAHHLEIISTSLVLSIQFFVFKKQIVKLT